MGRAHRVTTNKDKTVIVDGAGTPEAIKDRIKHIKAQIDEVESAFDREKLQERQAALAGGVAIIAVGAATETEMKERKARVEDALAATRAALEEGILPGGGVGLINALPALDKLKLDGDEATGVLIVKRALPTPVRWIAVNAGRDGAVVFDRVRTSAPGVGYNAETDEWGNMVDMGIIDPTMVVRAALENAASVANMVIITNALVSDIPEKKIEAPPQPEY